VSYNPNPLLLEGPNQGNKKSDDFRPSLPDTPTRPPTRVRQRHGTTTSHDGPRRRQRPAEGDGISTMYAIHAIALDGPHRAG
jgi:hypothetical protein